MAVSKERVINIMLIGETGVGKSTFINAFANYMLYESLEEAELCDGITHLVPAKFTVTDDDFVEKTICVGGDENKCNTVGESAMQFPKSYVVPVGDGTTKVRLIDTPSIEDTRDIENVLEYINVFEELHSICILLKPNARLTVLFEFCIKQMLSRLEKSAIYKIKFIFTNSRSTFYHPSDTLPALKRILNDMQQKPPHVEIPLTKKNVFCVDNEAFRFLVSIKTGITFTELEKQDFALSWKISSNACWSLVGNRKWRTSTFGLPELKNKTNMQYYQKNTSPKSPCTTAIVAPTKERVINIMLIGETGVGKSTFINAFVNYMLYESLEKAELCDLTYLIPTKFTVTGDDCIEKTICVGDDENKCNTVGESATQFPKSYVVPVGDGTTKVRLIDTPSIEDTRGIENVLEYINVSEELHGICILLKPNNARLTVLFEFCIKQMLSRLEKSASSNIKFIFTNSRSTFYRPGDTLPALKRILNDMQQKPPHVEIPLTKKNVFCLDNEAFRFLVSIKNGIIFTELEKQDFALSWQISANACRSLINYNNYTLGYARSVPLESYKVKYSISIIRARNVVLKLSQPLANIAQLVIDRLNILQRHEKDLQDNTYGIEDMKQKLYIPVVNLKVEELSRPITICTSPSCCTVYQIENIKKWHYSTRCHNPCNLTNVPREIVGSPELIHCMAMNGSGKCTNCSCDYRVHMHIYYQTEVISESIIDENVQSKITTEESAMEELKKHLVEINKIRDEYEKEREILIKSTAKFEHFLENNAIAPYNDAYQAYIEYLIDRENSMGESADKDMIIHLKELLKRYNEEKATLMSSSVVTAEDVLDTVQQLYGLKYTGSKIKELFDKQTSAPSYECNEKTEYVHP